MATHEQPLDVKPTPQRMTPLQRIVARTYLQLPRSGRDAVCEALIDAETVRREPHAAVVRVNAALRLYAARLYSGAIVDKDSVSFAESLDSRDGDTFTTSLFDRLGGDGYTLIGIIYKEQ